jgi:hypothetical protein
MVHAEAWDMRILKICAWVGAVIIPLMLNGRPPEPAREAAVKLTSRSIRLTAATGVTSRSMTFSTPAYPRFSGNGEFRPSIVRPGFHESAYAIFEGETRVETGIIFVQLPVADTNANGVADVIDHQAGVDATISGDLTPKDATVGVPVSLHLLRVAGADTGAFDISVDGAPMLGGNYSVLHREGTLEYQRTDAGALLNFDFSGTITNSKGISRVLDPNTVKILAFRLRVSPTQAIRVGPTLLQRSGQVYQGTGLLSDGLPATLTRDFRSYVLQITDINDRDVNGVPDFSDALPPFIKVQPSRKIAAVGTDVILSVVVEGTAPFTFEWQQNGHELSNISADPNQRVLVIPNATLDDRGSYRVRVSNAVGTVWSESTSVSFIGE